MTQEALVQSVVAVVLFEGFTVLDVYGAVQAFAAAGARQAEGTYQRFFKIVTVAQAVGSVRSGEGPASVAEYSFADLPACDVLLIPGGMGTRKAVSDEEFISLLRRASADAPMTATVCTGDALLARTGLLDNRPATSDKLVRTGS